MSRTTCNLCGSSDIKAFYHFESLPIFCGTLPKEEKLGFSYHKDLIINYCGHCGLIFQSDAYRSAEDLQHVYEAYSYPSPSISGVGLQQARDFLEFVNEGLRNKKQGRALEIGCLDGFFLHLLKQQGWEVFGCDPAPQVEIAKDKHGVQIIKDFFEEGLYEENSFDLVVMRNLLEHLPDPKSTLIEISKILKRGGFISIEVPETLKLLEVGMIGVFHHEHLYYFTSTTLKSLLESSGFICIKEAESPKRLHYLGENHRRSHPVVSFSGDVKAKQAKKLLSTQLKRLREELAPLLNDWRTQDLKVVIWGAGGHTQYFLTLSDLSENEVAFIVDKDASRQGRVLAGFSLEVWPPSKLKDYEAHVVIVSSYDFQEEIIKDIKDMGISTKILRLYPHIGYV